MEIYKKLVVLGLFVVSAGTVLASIEEGETTPTEQTFSCDDFLKPENENIKEAFLETPTEMTPDSENRFNAVAGLIANKKNK